MPEGIEKYLPWAPPVNPRFAFALPSETKTHTRINNAGSHLAPAVGRTTETAAVQVLAGRQRNTGGIYVGDPFSANAPLAPGTPAGGSRLKVRGVKESAATAKEATEMAAPAANVFVPPFSAAGGGDGTDERESYAFRRRFSSRDTRSEEQHSPSTLIAGRTSSSETIPATEEAPAKLATASSGVAKATVFSVGCAADKRCRGREFVPHASKPTFFSFGAESNFPAAGAENVSGVHSLVGGEGSVAGGRKPYVFGRGVVSRRAGSKEESAPSTFTFRAPNSASGTVPIPAVAAAKETTASFVVAMATVSSIGVAGNGEGRGKRLAPHVCESNRLPFGVAASSAVAGDGLARMPASTVAPVPTVEIIEAKPSAAHLPTVGPAQSSQRALGLRGEKATFGASNDVDAIDTTIAPPIVPLIAKSTGTTIRKGMKYVVSGRRVSSDEAIVYAMEARLRAIQGRSKNPAAIGRQIERNERVRPKILLEVRGHDDGRNTNVDNTADVDINGEVKYGVDVEEEKEEGDRDDDCGAQVSLGVKQRYTRLLSTVWRHPCGPTPFRLLL